MHGGLASFGGALGWGARGVRQATMHVVSQPWLWAPHHMWLPNHVSGSQVPHHGIDYSIRLVYLD